MTRGGRRFSTGWVTQGPVGSGQDWGLSSVLEEKPLKGTERNFLELDLTLITMAMECRGTSGEAKVAPVELELGLVWIRVLAVRVMRRGHILGV